jgi:DNA-binding NarL/FixJ family response regulator
VRCKPEELLEKAVRRHPDLVLFGIGDDPESDVRTLHVLRRLLPDVPLIFLAEGVTLGQRRSFQEFRPMFWALEVDDEADLQAAITAALKGRLEARRPS